MAYVVSQPTLIAHCPELDDLLRSMGPFLACAWCALERSRTLSAPVAPDGLASQAIGALASLRVLHEAPFEVSPHIARSLYEPLAWRYQEPWTRPGAELASHLHGALARWAVDCAPQAKQRLWASLAQAELSAYLTNRLRRHRMDASIGGNLRSMQLEEWEQLGLGRKRYVIWSSVRSAASEFLQSGMTAESARAALDREIATRARWLSLRARSGSLARTDYCFVPSNDWRQPLILDVAMETFLPLGQLYWLAPVGTVSV